MGKKTKRKLCGTYREIALGMDPMKAVVGSKNDILVQITNDENVIKDMFEGDNVTVSLSVFMDANSVYHSLDHEEHSYICLDSNSVLQDVVLLRKVEEMVRVKDEAGHVKYEYPVLSDDYVICYFNTLTSAIGSSNAKNFEQVEDIVTYGEMFRISENSRQKVREKVGN